MNAQERTPKDYAIEVGEYLAKAAEHFMDEQNKWDMAVAAGNDDDCDARSDAWNSLRSAIYEFRKRAARASSLPKATPQTDPLREFSHDQAERDFLNVSIAVWREIDRLMKLGPYPGIHMATDLRISEKLAWERYRAFLDKDECKCVPCPKCGGRGANLTDAPNKEPTDSEVCGECGGSGEIETCSYCRGLLEENV